MVRLISLDTQKGVPISLVVVEVVQYDSASLALRLENIRFHLVIFCIGYLYYQQCIDLFFSSATSGTFTCEQSESNLLTNIKIFYITMRSFTSIAADARDYMFFSPLVLSLYLRKTNEALVPPKPKLLLVAI